jgi:hypothetical protein
MQFFSDRSLAKAVLLTVLIAGTLDIADALIFFGLRFHVTPTRIFQNIASHLIGRSAFAGRIRSTLLGVALHYLIATCWIAAFILVAQRLPLLFRQPLLCGALYGLLIYAVMNYLVLPHTRNPTNPTHDPINLLNAILALVIFMGIVVALLNRRFAPLPTQF